jgi:hypothetical protein
MPKGIVLRPPLITILESKCYGAAAQSSSSRTAGTHGRPEVRFHTTAAARVAKFPVNYELPHTGALKNMGDSISPSSTRRRGKANAHRDRYRRRGRDWPDLVGRSDVRVGPRGQRRRRAKHPDGSRHWSPLLKMPTLDRSRRRARLNVPRLRASPTGQLVASTRLAVRHGAPASLAPGLARTSQPLPPCQQQEGKEEHEARKVDGAGEGLGRVRIGQRHPISRFPASDERE